MYISRKNLLMLLSVVNMYLTKYSWKDLEDLRAELIEKLWKGGLKWKLKVLY